VAIFQQRRKRNFNSIIAPLQDIELDLSLYISEQEDRILFLEEERTETKNQLDRSKSEKSLSEDMLIKIGQLLSK
jgi:hypothetical protein